MNINDFEEELRKIRDKEYPPEEEYERFEAIVDMWDKWLEQTVKDMKYFPAPEQAIKRLQIANLENMIAKGRRNLKEFKEAAEKVEEADKKIEEAEAGVEEALQAADRAHEKLYIIIKHTKPHLFEGFRQISVDSLTPEELKEFLERIAHLEATQLEEILAGK